LKTYIGRDYPAVALVWFAQDESNRYGVTPRSGTRYDATSGSETDLVYAQMSGANPIEVFRTKLFFVRFKQDVVSQTFNIRCASPIQEKF